MFSLTIRSLLILKFDIFNTSADKTTAVSGLRTGGSFPLQQRGGKLLQYLQTEPNNRTHHFTLIKTLSGDLECARHSQAIHYLIHGGDRNESFLSKQVFPSFFPSHQSTAKASPSAGEGAQSHSARRYLCVYGKLGV